ncbi:hypothetical protein FMM74_019885 [Lachnospiraceae bacterium MD308]|nr:hypothetical protein [Lachnospiraceae bacterium MD308]
MTEKEFRKLKALDLIQMLLTQSNEVSAQQEELDRMDIRLELLFSENDIIKAKLNDRDAMTELIKQKLNESDERIRELEKEVKSLYSDRIIELEEAGSLVQAALELNKIFEAAQKEAERYMYGAERGIEGRRYHAVGMTDRSQESQRIKPAEDQPELARDTFERQRQSKAEVKPIVKEVRNEEFIAGKLGNEEPITGEPITEKPTTEELITEKPTIEEPTTEELKNLEPSMESVESEGPPGLEAFNWRLEEEQPQAGQPEFQMEEPPKEAEPSKEPPVTKAGGLFDRLFGRRQK